MFVILATKPTQDGCKGFRFNFLGIKGIYRKRSIIRRWGRQEGACMLSYHFGKRSLYIEKSANTRTRRKFRHVAG